MQTLAQILVNLKERDAGKYLSQEWQLFAYRLAQDLNDMKRISFYMKLAKNENRTLLEKSWDFVKEANNPRSRAALFLWKLKELKKASVPAEGAELTKKEESNQSAG